MHARSRESVQESLHPPGTQAFMGFVVHPMESRTITAPVQGPQRRDNFGVDQTEDRAHDRTMGKVYGLTAGEEEDRAPVGQRDPINVLT